MHGTSVDLAVEIRESLGPDHGDGAAILSRMALHLMNTMKTPDDYEMTVARLRRICDLVARARGHAKHILDANPLDPGYQFLYTTLVENERKAEDAYVAYVTRHTIDVEGA